MVSISIITHGHGKQLFHLVSALLTCEEVHEVLITLNLPEAPCLPRSHKIKVIRNTTPRGFSANHNQAFLRSTGQYFCVVNPDIQLQADPFPVLLQEFVSTKVGIVAPLVKNSSAEIEDSIRYFPTVFSIFKKLLFNQKMRYEYAENDPSFDAQWAAGMFLIFDRNVYEKLKGFDEKFFLYYEDVDICLRAWRLGYLVRACPSVGVIHDARRDSHKKLRFLMWHLRSISRYFIRYCCRLPSGI